MASPLEEYMAELVSQHKLKETITDTDYQNDLAQSQADEQLAINEIDSLPFNMAARSYNMDPSEWVGKEAEGRARMKQAVSSSYLSQRAKTANNQASGRKEFTQNLLGTLNRLNSVNSRGIGAVEDFAPKDAGLRSHLVFDPESGSVNQQAKNLPDEDAVRNKEIAEYLQVPEHVVQQQRSLEQQTRNDANWKELRRTVMLDKDLRSIARAEKADERADAKAKWTQRMEQANAALKFSKESPDFVNQIISQPDTPPEMKEAASIGNALRPAIAAARQEKDKTKWKKLVGTMANKYLQNDSMYQQSVASGKADIAKLNLAIQGAVQILEAEGITEQSFSEEEFNEDFGMPNPGGTLSELEQFNARRPAELNDEDRLRSIQFKRAQLRRDRQKSKSPSSVREQLRRYTQ